MRILYVCHEPLPSPSTSTEQLLKAAGSMASLGVDVTVTTPVKTGDASALADEVAAFYDIAPELFRSGLELAPLPPPLGLGGPALRPVHDVQAARFAQRVAPEVVYVRDPIPLVTALRTGLPVVFETYRYDLNERGLYAPWRAACYGRDNLVGVVTHSGLARRSFLDAGFDEDAVIVAHNGYDPPEGGALDRAEARGELGLDAERPLVVYAGGVSQAKGLESVVHLAQALSHVDILVVGHVPGDEGARWLGRLLDQSGVTNVRMVPRVPPAEVHRYLSAADCLFIPTVAAPLLRTKRTVLPMKTFPYLGAARPIVAPDLDDVAEVLTDGVNALLVAPDDPAQTVAAVQRVLEDRSLADRLAEGARSTAGSLGWVPRAQKILDFVEHRNSPVSGGV